MTLSLQVAFNVDMLTPEEETELTQKAFEHKCQKSINRLVSSHMRLVAALAKRYVGYNLPFDDLFQEGCVGLLKSATKFDPSVGARFATFAAHQIKSEIALYALDNVRSYRIATTKAQRKLFFNLNKYRDVSQGQLTPDDVKLIAHELNVSEQNVRTMEVKLRGTDQSIDDEDNGLLEYSLATRKTDPARMVEEAEWEEVTRERIKEAVDSLSERERDVFYHRVVAEDKKTLAELAEEQGCSAERIRQVEIRAIAKVREFVERFA